MRKLLPASLGHHDLDKLIIIDLAITIHISLPDHLINFLICELLAQVGHHMTEFSSRDESILTLKASLSSSSESVSFIFLAIRLRNSGKSMVPFPSASTSLIMSWSSASVGFCPSDLITVPSSFVVIQPAR
ncbi:hypothetical protein V2J09_024022 [Rumex salicifolius]